MENLYEVDSEWKIDRSDQLPDFIIGGAMKSGTTTLHSILDTHPDVFLPSTEVHFFDMDNPFQHRDFNYFSRDSEEWVHQMGDIEKRWNWYLSHFEEKQNYVTGEDSTTYLASKIAAKRISVQDKDIKLIFLLRHPTKRAYSQYFHMLISGRAIYNFEDTIRFRPSTILSRSMYKKQLKWYYNLLDRDQIKVILFEEFIKNPESIMEEVSEFLNLEFDKFDDDAFNLHSNPAKIPMSISLQIFFNRFAKHLRGYRYFDQLPNDSNNSENKYSYKILKKAHRFLNPLQTKEKPPIRKSTRSFLDYFFKRKLQGIDELTKRNILEQWFPND